MLKTLWRKLIGDLKTNRGQFLAVWLVVMLGTTFYGAMYPAGVNLLASLYAVYDDLVYMDFQVQADSFTPQDLAAVRAIEGVTAVQERLVIDAGVQIDPDHAFLTDVRLVSVPDEGESQVNQSHLARGGEAQATDEVLLLKRFADRHGIVPGDTLTVWLGGHKHHLRVAGLVINPEYLVAGRSPEAPFPIPTSFGVAWVRYAELDAMIGGPGIVNDLAIRLAGATKQIPTELRQSVRGELEAIFPDREAVSILDRIQTASGGVMDANVKGNFPVMTFFSSMFLVGAALITSVLLGRQVEGDRQCIGTLRALGVSRYELVLHYLSFGALIGTTGALVGSLAGYANSFWVMGIYMNYIAGEPFPGWVNTPQMPFILLGFVVVSAGATLAGAYPAWVQSGVHPGIALRPAVPSNPSVISRIPLGFLPLTLRQTLRNLLRVPGRSAGAALGLLLGAMMIFASLALFDSMNINLDEYYAANQFDLRAEVRDLQPAEALEVQIRRLEGVAAVQAALMGPIAVLRADGSDFNTIGIAVDEMAPFFDLVPISGAPAFSSAGGVWIGHNLARVLEVDQGDTITIKALGKARQIEVRGVVSYALGSPVFVPRSLIAQWMPGGLFFTNTALVRVEPGQMEVVKDGLTKVPGLIAVQDYPAFIADLDEYMDYFRSGTMIFGGFGIILAVAVILNTVNTSLHERQSELAILRSLGTSRKEIALGATLELLVMVVLGLVIGTPLGRAIGFMLRHNYETEFWGMRPHLQPISYGIGIMGLIAIVLLSEIPGLRAAYRVDLGQVSKSQSI